MQNVCPGSEVATAGIYTFAHYYIQIYKICTQCMQNVQYITCKMFAQDQRLQAQGLRIAICRLHSFHLICA